jgi:signal peptidase I
LGLAASGAIAAALLPGHSPYATVDEPSAAMTPTVQVGDHVIVAKDLNPVRGDVVEVTWETDGQRYTGISRVIGIGGDTVSCPPIASRCAGVIVDQRQRVETYAKGPTAPFPAVTVPAGHVFLLGDNRGNASDSRELGPVALEQVKGVVVRIRHDGRTGPVPGAPPHPGPGSGQNVDPPSPPPSANSGSA